MTTAFTVDSLRPWRALQESARDVAPAAQTVTALLAHAGGSDEIAYAVSAVVLALAVWLAVDAVRRRRAARGAADEPPPDDPA